MFSRIFRIINKYDVAFFLCLLFIVVAGQRFWDYKIKKDFQVYSVLECDPTFESCFIYDDDVENPYKKIEIMYQFAPSCLEEHTCKDFNCDGLGLGMCAVISCDEQILEVGEACY